MWNRGHGRANGHACTRLASGLVSGEQPQKPIMDHNTQQPNQSQQPVPASVPGERPKRKRLVKPVFRTHLFRA